MGWALLSWGLSARERSGHIVHLSCTSDAVYPFENTASKSEGKGLRNAWWLVPSFESASA
jgi:hypothetical protein